MTASFVFSEEQDALRAAVRRFCAERAPVSEVRRLMDTAEGFDPDTWKQLAAGMGLAALRMSATFSDLTVVLEEMGRSLLPSPFLSSSCLALTALLNAGAPDELLEPIVSGERRAALALAEPSGRWDAAGICLEATPHPDGFTLSGTKSYVIDGHTADVLAVIARAGGTQGSDGLGVYVVDADASGVSRQAVPTLDLTRKQATVTFDGAVARCVGAEGVDKTLWQAAVFLAAESVGVAESCLDMGVAYAKERIQFGKPIGQFQAVKHMCADMLLRLESARSASYYATWCAERDNDELPVAASLAKATCTEVAFANACTNHQILGGIGFTYEHDAHLYYRRAKTNELYLGDPAYHRELIASRLGI